MGGLCLNNPVTRGLLLAAMVVPLLVGPLLAAPVVAEESPAALPADARQAAGGAEASRPGDDKKAQAHAQGTTSGAKKKPVPDPGASSSSRKEKKKPAKLATAPPANTPAAATDAAGTAAVPINLHLVLPQNLDPVATALPLESRTQALPDLFLPKTDDGRVSFDGSLLVEEDLELNPGAGLDNRDSRARDAKDEKTDVLDDIEGAQLNIRFKID